MTCSRTESLNLKSNELFVNGNVCDLRSQCSSGFRVRSNSISMYCSPIHLVAVLSLPTVHVWKAILLRVDFFEKHLGPRQRAPMGARPAFGNELSAVFDLVSHFGAPMPTRNKTSVAVLTCTFRLNCTQSLRRSRVQGASRFLLGCMWNTLTGTCGTIVLRRRTSSEQ